MRARAGGKKEKEECDGNIAEHAWERMRLAQGRSTLQRLTSDSTMYFVWSAVSLSVSSEIRPGADRTRAWTFSIMRAVADSSPCVITRSDSTRIRDAIVVCKGRLPFTHDEHC